jgi:hypothetical protein
MNKATIYPFLPEFAVKIGIPAAGRRTGEPAKKRKTTQQQGKVGENFFSPALFQRRE